MYALESQFDQHMPIKTKTLIAGRDIVSDSMSVFYTLFYFPLTVLLAESIAEPNKKLVFNQHFFIHSLF